MPSDRWHSDSGASGTQEPLLTMQEAADFIGMPFTTFRRKVAQGKFPYYNFGQKNKRFLASELLAVGRVPVRKPDPVPHSDEEYI